MTTMLAPVETVAALPHALPVRFLAGMPGLEAYTRFTLIDIDGSAVYWLQCDDEPEIALPVAEAFAILPDYACDLSAADARSLGLVDESEALVLTVLTVPESGDITANLLAPIVINRVTGRARQVILDRPDYDLRHPVGGARE